MSNVEVERRQTKEIKEKLKHVVKKLKERFWLFRLKYQEDGSVSFYGEIGCCGKILTINIRAILNEFGKTKYVAVMQYSNLAQKIQNRKELEEWITKKPIVIEVKEHDTTIKIERVVKTPSGCAFLNDDERKEFIEWEKLPENKRSKLYEERIKFLLVPHYREAIVEIQTYDPDYLIKLLSNYQELLSFSGIIETYLKKLF